MSHQIVRKIVLAAYVFMIAASVDAQWNDDIPPDQGAAGLYHSLLQLKTTLKVMHIVAHPDDEDGAMLTYCARGMGANTLLFSVTRGEGGANLISKHAFDELGILRTLEHAESAKYYGVEVRYSSAADYGYSKTLDEANAHWGRDERVLRELVAEVRRFKPDVIVSRFRGDARDGHGHHQFAGVLAQQSFLAAGDATRFPELNLEPWQPKKLYTNNIRPEWRPEDKDAWTLAVPTGEFNPVLGRSYAQVARYGLGFQRSQGFTGHDGPAGESASYYRLAQTTLKDQLPNKEQSFLDGLDTSILGLNQNTVAWPADWIESGLRRIQGCIDRAWAAYDPRNLEAVAPSLMEGIVATSALQDELNRHDLETIFGPMLQDRLAQTKTEFELALRRALGISFEAYIAGIDPHKSEESPDGVVEIENVVPGQAVQVTVRVVQRSRLRVELYYSWAALGGDTQLGITELDFEDAVLENNKPWTRVAHGRVPEETPLTRPAWKRDDIATPFYEQAAAVESDETPPRPQAGVQLRVNDIEIDLTTPLTTRYQHPEYGELRQPLEIVPRVSVAFAQEHAVMLKGRREHVVNVVVRNGAIEASQGTVAIDVPTGWRAEPAEQAFSLSRADETQPLSFTLIPPESLDGAPVTIKAVGTCAERTYTEGYETITARDLGRVNYYRPAEQRLHVVDVEVPPGLQVGYVMGAGDELPAALAQLGVATTLLDAAELAKGDLSRFNTIMIGIRAYAVRADLIAANARLLEYVHGGGTLVVHYQTPEFDRNFGPFPYTMGRNPEEVSEEDARVTLLHPDHPLLMTPNRITPADFDGWFEQRGSKFWQTWDEHYQPLLECHDQGQPQQNGGLLYVRHGQGAYIYSAYALYRQVPLGVSGAYRLLANLAAHRPIRP